jgi:hypothetical protein
MVATKWNWDIRFMLAHFGWKAVIGILITTSIYYVRFQKELLRMKPTIKKLAAKTRPIPTHIHLLYDKEWRVFSIKKDMEGNFCRIAGSNEMN